jgi:DivIVA domain-containing protein
MPEERLKTITSSPHLAPDDVARHTFGSVRRGFDPDEVRAYLESLAVGLRGLAEQENQLLQQVADAEHRAAHPVLDDAALTEALGAETTRVLHSAHEAASAIVAKAEAESHRMLTEAQEQIEGDRTRTAASLAEQTSAAESAAAELRERSERQAAAKADAARNEAEELLSQARHQCREMVEEAQALRARVLADLSKRRKVLHAQIEQLRAGREKLAETVQDVRRSVDAIAEELFAAEDNARLAAEAAGRQAAARPEEGTPEELAALLLAEEEAGPADEEVGPADEEPSEAKPPEADPVPEAAAESSMADEPGRTPDGADSSGPTGPEEPSEPSEPESAEAPDESPVEALFAKIRASSQPGKAPDADAEGATVSGSGASGDEEPDGDEDGPPEDRNPAAARRDELIAPIMTTLSRRLKRTLQDSQNELLDQLRSTGSHWSVGLLPEEIEQVDGYATAALPALEQASAAGASLAGTDSASRPSADVLIGIAHDLAEAIVGPLRRKLTVDDGELTDADEAVVAEHVGSAFREWKGERIERLAGDHVVAAFSAGTIATAADSPLEWVAVAGSGDAPCPDCEDNSLSGSQPPGEEFPTGHRHPPAHSGCRCLLTPSAV